MQPTLLRVYKWTSTRWHEFLHLTSKMMPRPEATVVERVVESPSPLLREPPGIATSSSPGRRRTLPWPHDAPETARPARQRASPGYQIRSSRFFGRPRFDVLPLLCSSQLKLPAEQGFTIKILLPGNSLHLSKKSRWRSSYVTKTSSPFYLDLFQYANFEAYKWRLGEIRPSGRGSNFLRSSVINALVS